MSSLNSERMVLLQTIQRQLQEMSTTTVLFHQQVAETLGLNITDNKCLNLVLKHGPMRAGQLAELSGLTTGGITGVLDRLEKAGFIKRLPDLADRRTIVIEAIHEKIHEKITPLFDSLGEAVNDLCLKYSDEELSLLGEFISRTNQLLLKERDSLSKNKLKRTVYERNRT